MRADVHSDGEANGMNAQTVTVLVVVSLAAMFIARRAWRTMKAAKKSASGCGAECGCGTGTKVHSDI